MLIEQIKADQLQARKNRDTVKASLLTTLIGEAETKAKNTGVVVLGDAEVIALLKKFADGVKMVIESRPSADATLELQILEAYMPKALTDSDLRAIIATKKAEGMNMGQVMKFLKDNFAGQYDGKVASDIFKEV